MTATGNFIDTHAHLDFPEFRDDFNEVLRRARDVGVSRIITIGSGNKMNSAGSAVEISRKNSNIWATVGIHPHDSLLDFFCGASFDDRPSSDLFTLWKKEAAARIEILKNLSIYEKVVGIGEIGLDYHYKFSPRPVQTELFNLLLALAIEIEKPVVIHDREAHEDMLAVLKNFTFKNGGILHCFSGDTRLAMKVIEMGFYISIPGVVTFKNSVQLADVVRNIPIEKMILETDSPFLAPVPFRGKRNEPSHIPLIAEKVAELKGLNVDDVARITTRNAVRIFNLPDEEEMVRIVYPIRDSLYLNITNRCTLACVFCAKRRDWSVKGHFLRLEHEPSAEELISSCRPLLGKYVEVVFCGYGEPLLRPDIVKSVSAELKKSGIKIRVNTDGLASLVHGRDITAELAGLVDSYSVSLNAGDAETYARLCPSRFGGAAHAAVKDFILAAKRHATVTASAVAVPGLDIESVRKLAEKELGVEFRERAYNNLG